MDRPILKLLCVGVTAIVLALLVTRQYQDATARRTACPPGSRPNADATIPILMY